MATEKKTIKKIGKRDTSASFKVRSYLCGTGHHWGRIKGKKEIITEDFRFRFSARVPTADSTSNVCPNVSLCTPTGPPPLRKVFEWFPNLSGTREPGNAKDPLQVQGFIKRTKIIKTPPSWSGIISPLSLTRFHWMIFESFFFQTNFSKDWEDQLWAGRNSFWKSTLLRAKDAGTAVDYTMQKFKKKYWNKCRRL